MKRTNKESNIGKALGVISGMIFAIGITTVCMGISDDLGITEVLSNVSIVLASGSIPLGFSEVIKLISNKSE